MTSPRYAVLFRFAACFLATVALTAEARAQSKRPNIVVIWGDDIGQSNISAYTHGRAVCHDILHFSVRALVFRL